MTLFLRLLSDQDKRSALASAVEAFRNGKIQSNFYYVAPEAFKEIPGSSFAYWVGENVRGAFSKFPSFSSGRTTACITNPAGDDKRYIRTWWEVNKSNSPSLSWRPIAKGGSFSPYYYDVHLVVAWNPIRGTYLGFVGTEHRPLEKPASVDYFFRPGVTWPSRTQVFGPRVMPAGCVFTGKGPAAFDEADAADHLLANCALMNSLSFKALVGTRLNAADSTARSFEVGIIQKTPAPALSTDHKDQLALLARHSWSMKRNLDTVDETSHAFLLPSALRARISTFDPLQIDAELSRVQASIDELTFELYGFSKADRTAIAENMSGTLAENSSELDEEEPDDVLLPADSQSALLSWSVGITFGRFDWRLATGERAAPPEPEPFDPLPVKSPGMLPDGTAPFHTHAGILVDDQGHPHDLAHLVEEVLGRVDMPVPDDVRRWLQRDFFGFHFQRYSKSRRKAPIYWPLATASGSYTLWLYYPSLSSQTLYTAINDFVEPKLKEVGAGGTALRNKGSARTRDEEKQFETLQAFELELIELRDTLLKIAQGYQPNHDDGVQITAAPLWPLFRHKPWQKVLKDTWAKLEKGDYDWAHLAMSYWPARVREKCKTDKSLAIAHGLEALYVEPEAKPKKMRGKKNAGAIE
jgi:hypothetical protein